MDCVFLIEERLSVKRCLENERVFLWQMANHQTHISLVMLRMIMVQTLTWQLAPLNK